MFLYEDKLSVGLFNTLSHQKIKFKKNNVASLKQYSHRWNKYLQSGSNFRTAVSTYIRFAKNDLSVSITEYWYKSRKSEAWYFTLGIDGSKTKLRLANHDTKDDTHFDECLWLSEYVSMKGIYKAVLRFIDKCILEWRKRVTVDNFDSYFNLALKRRQEYDTCVKFLKESESQKEEYNSSLESLLNKHKIYEDAIEYLKEIIELISRQHVEHIEKLLNSAVKTIFYDKDYSIKLEISEYRNNNSLSIFLEENTDEGTIITDIKNNGFGIQGVVGFVLQVYFILYHKLYPTLIMDEAMSTLSTQYLPYFKELIDALVKQYNFEFVLVAHDPRFIDVADYKYEVKDGEVRKV